MMTDSAHRTVSARPSRVWWINFLAIAMFWGCYVVVQTPLPAVNEPHYICKAKHFWQPAYCPGDFFLDSSNTHFVFYVAFGWLTTFLSLETTALIGRTFGLGLLAAGWTSLVLRLSAVRWAPIGSAALFLGVTSWQNFSGEWIVGGIESKVIAYSLVFLSWTQVLRRAWNAAGGLLGLGISFHPVVGVWSLAATLISLATAWWNKHGRESLPGLREVVTGGTLLMLTALPGLIPAFGALQSSVPNAAESDRLQVFERLGHHLNPVQFPLKAYVLYGGLLVFWLGGVRLRERLDRSAERGSEPRRDNHANRMWTGIVAGSVAIALAGLVIGWLQWLAGADLLVKLMKFYPFRLADVLLPMAAAISLIGLTDAGRRSVRWMAPAVMIVCLVSAGAALTLNMPSRNPERHSPDKMASWIGICRWVDENLPPEAVVMTPTSSTTFRWYASRAAYVTFKDCPQDAAGILEWDRRLKLYKAWASRSYKPDQSFSATDLAELARLTGASYLIASRMGPMETDPIHRNRHYRVYRLPQTEPSAAE